MIKNYIKIAWRNLMKNRFYSSLNIVGLAIGIMVFLTLSLYIQGELSFDRFHKQADHIYRVGVAVAYDDVKEKWAKAPNIAGPEFKSNIREVVEQVRLLRHNFGKKASIEVGDKSYVENSLYWADPTLFDVFTVPLVSGDPASALDGPNKMIISEQVSKKMFNTANPVGRTIKIDNSLELEITGVYKDFSNTSTLDCGMIGSFNSLKWASERLYWSNVSYETFLLTQEGTNKEDLEIAMNAVLDKAVDKEDQWFSFWAQPFLEVHLYSTGIAEAGYSSRLGDANQVRIMGMLAIAVLLLACFNYINMATARSQQRFREVGINKTLGASSRQMIGRFLVETGVLVGIAMMLGIVLVNLALPFSATLTGQTLMFSKFAELEWLFGLVALGIAITILAGLYPALFLSNYSPKKLLSAFRSTQSGNSFFRQFLVVGQFTVCVALITGVLIFKQQLNFISTKNLGFEAEHVVAINTFKGGRSAAIEGLVNTYKSNPSITKVTRVQGYPGIDVGGYSMHRPGDESMFIGVRANRVNPGFDEVLGLNIIAGRTLPPKTEKDTTVQVLLNETAVKFLGWSPEDAIGKTPPALFNYDTEIVGVVEDFHFESLHTPIGAYAFNNGNELGWMPYILVKLNTSELSSTLRNLEIDFKKYMPETAFEYDFLSDQTARLYASEQKMAKIISVFTFLTILISCLGLFGLAAFTTERRAKEISIRKVLGASITGIVSLLTKDFLKPVVLALFIAIPVSYYALNQWLMDFAYRIEMQWWVFALAGIIAVFVAFITVSFQGVNAAMTNPTKNFRSD